MKKHDGGARNETSSEPVANQSPYDPARVFTPAPPSPEPEM